MLKSMREEMKRLNDIHNTFIDSYQSTALPVQKMLEQKVAEQKAALGLVGDDDLQFSTSVSDKENAEPAVAPQAVPLSKAPVDLKYIPPKRGRGRPKRENEVNVDDNLEKILADYRDEVGDITRLTIRFLAEKIGCSQSSIKDSKVWMAIRAKQEEVRKARHLNRVGKYDKNET
jgi:hypothetical protein